MSFFRGKPKYNSTRISHAGYSFASKLEAAVFNILKVMEIAKKIQNLSTQKRVYLLRNPDIYYIPDFYFEEDGEPVYAEAKGYETPEWKIKKKLWQHFGPTRLDIYQGSYNNPKLAESIKPKTKGENNHGD